MKSNQNVCKIIWRISSKIKCYIELNWNKRKEMAPLWSVSWVLVEIPGLWNSCLLWIKVCLTCWHPFLLFSCFLLTEVKKIIEASIYQDCFCLFSQEFMKKSRRSERKKWWSILALSIYVFRITRPFDHEEICHLHLWDWDPEVKNVSFFDNLWGSMRTLKRGLKRFIDSWIKYKLDLLIIRDKKEE